MEARLRRAVQSGPQATAPDNISLPSPTPGTTSDTTQQHSATAGFSTSLAAPASASASSAPPPVQQPPIPDKVKQRILRGEYIDFDTLLPESLYPARYGASSTPAFTLRLSNDTSAGDGDVVIAQQKPVAKRSVCDLAAWTEAWNLYVQVLVAAFPDRAPVLLAYQAIICGASSRFPPRLWLRYDQRFRANAASDSTLRWDIRNNELWLKCFTLASTASASNSHSQTPSSSSSKSARRPCTYCGSFYHYPDNCPSHPFRAHKRLTPPRPRALQSASQTSLSTSANSTTPHPQLAPQPPPPHHHPCRDFNNGSCRRHTCRFSHVCAKCHEREHGERECPSAH